MLLTAKVHYKFLLLFSYLLLGFSVQAQRATVKEENMIIKTYPFSDPDPIPVLTTNPKIYPYHKFDGYSHTGRNQPWKVIHMENEYIQLSVLPEAGGKVWGAIEKSTGEEFIYHNEVMKFRNIAMRGPWTSGGIEFNFGLIGHAPTTATPVDYVIQEHDDGSVSCIVGAMDLPSRTQWRVKITLPPDKAYFETNSLWYNPTPLDHPYYNWMTAAALAREDLEFFYPGSAYLGHEGEAHPWPVDVEGRVLSHYKNNNFGSSKSYHVVGTYHNFFGGYWHDSKFGFGHWAPYEDMPGQKLWIWALSRSGGIWEDLLTDTDGQYIEFQAGRLFNQFSPSSKENPISEVAFAPYTTDHWREVWFPFKNIGGLSSASPVAAMHVTKENNNITFHINALQKLNDTLTVKAGDSVIFRNALILNPMEVYTETIALSSANQALKVTIGSHILYADTQKQPHQLQRPFSSEPTWKRLPADQLYTEGEEYAKGRDYAKALEKFEACLQKDPAHQAARIALAKLLYRKAHYTQALKQAKLALQADTYDFDANYVAGITYNAMGDQINAMEALGWAARSMKYRSAAYAQMAEIAMQTHQYDQAQLYANHALDYNRFNVSAHQVLAVLHRKKKDAAAARRAISQLLDLDPLNHFARFEQYLLDKNPEDLKQFSSLIRNEMPYQSYLEIAMEYLKMKQYDDATAVLRQSPPHPLADIWLAYLTRSDNKESEKHLQNALQKSPAFVFPYRQETLLPLAWAVQKQNHWKFKYYLGLNYWSMYREEEAANFLKACGNEANYAPFYLARADLLEKTEGVDKSEDINRALALDEGQWRSWHLMIQYLGQHQLYEKQLDAATRAHRKFSDSYVIGMDYAQALLNNEKYEQCISTLNNLKVLPYEGASEGRVIFEQVHLLSALEQIQKGHYQQAVKKIKTSLEWPENLGVGKPYNPDTRRQDFLLAFCFQKLNQTSEAGRHQQNTIDYTQQNAENVSFNHLLALITLKQQKKEAEIQQLLQTIKSSDSLHHPVTQWIMTYWQNDQKALKEIEEKNQFFENNNFKIVKKLLEIL